MGKSFRALIVEQDQEYTYDIRSTRNIHKDDVMDFVRLALLPYDLRELKMGTYISPLTTSGNGFISEPWAGVYTLKAILGIEPPDNRTAIQKIALFTNINDEYLLVNKEGESEKQLDNSDDEVCDSKDYNTLVQHAKDWDATTDDPTSPEESQKLAGNKRLGDFFKELEKDRKEREDDIGQHNVDPVLTEAFVTSHMALKEVTGQSRLKGFYLAERFKENDKILHLSGPFKNLPDNYAFLPEMGNMAGGALEIINETSLRLIDFDPRFRFTHIVELAVPKPREVTVLDQDTGKEYHVIVRSMDETDARSKAITQVANKYKLDSQNLLADDPDSA